MARLEAEFLEGNRVIFSARGRSFVNARETLPDGPIGYSSGELLLIALANCSLGILTNHELMKDVPIRRCKVVLDSEGESNPSRITSISAVVELEVDEVALAERRDTLERAINHCPVGNTLRFSPEVTIQLNIKTPEAAAIRP